MYTMCQTQYLAFDQDKSSCKLLKSKYEIRKSKLGYSEKILIVVKTRLRKIFTG